MSNNPVTEEDVRHTLDIAIRAVEGWLNTKARYEGRLADDGSINNCSCEGCAECYACAFISMAEEEDT